MRDGADPSIVLQSADYFFWDADEVLDTIRWAQANHVEVAGVDCAHPHTSIEMVLAYLQRVDPGERAHAADRYGCLSQYAAHIGNYTNVPSSIQEQCRANVAEVRPVIESHRDDYEQRSTHDEYEHVLHAARVVEQGERSLTVYPQSRDACMAENIQWLASANRSARIIFWGHNEHLGKTGYTLDRTEKSTGAYLTESFGDDYRAVGTIALGGSFWAYNASFFITEQEMTPASADDYATFFAKLGRKELFVPFARTLPPWLESPHRIRIGASTAGTHELIENLPQRFDGMIYIETSTPSQLRHFPQLR